MTKKLKMLKQLFYNLFDSNIINIIFNFLHSNYKKKRFPYPYVYDIKLDRKDKYYNRIVIYD